MCRCTRQRIAYLAAVLLGCAGIWLCGELVRQDAGIWPERGDGLLTRLCRTVTPANASCAGSAGGGPALSVPVPRYSAAQGLALGRMRVPLAFVGLGYFVCATVWLVVVGLPRVDDGWWRAVPGLAASLACVLSVLLLVKMARSATSICGTCIIAHTINFLLGSAVLAMTPRRQATPSGAAPGSASGRVRLAGVAVAVGMLAVGGLWWHRHEQLALARTIHSLTPYRDVVVNLRSDGEHLRREHYLGEPVAISPRDAAEASARIVVFTDYNCSACRCSERRMQTVLGKALAAGLTVDYRPVPRCRACAAGKPAGPHAAGCAAAYAAEAARQLGGPFGFSHMHAELFAERGPWTDERLTAIARKIGLDAAEFQQALHSETVRSTVEADQAAATAAAVDAVPAVFLDGRRVGPLSADNPLFWKAVAAANTCPDEDRFAESNAVGR